MSLTQIQLKAFLSMAGTNRDEFTAMEQSMAGLPEEIRAALNELESENKKEAAKVTAKVIFEAFKAADADIINQIEEIRSARRRETAAKEAIRQIQRAKAFASETGNYIPLLIRTNEISFVAANAMQKEGAAISIPDNWQPKVAPVKVQLKPKAK